MTSSVQRIAFFQSPRHDCGYFPGRPAQTVFAHPEIEPDRATQSTLARHGFRRSGRFIYRPSCPGCNACIPVRVPAREFKLSRSQRRVLRRNRDLVFRLEPARVDDEILALYQKYQSTRHPEGQMLAPGSSQYNEYFAASWSDTWNLTFTLAGRLACVAIADRLDDAWSAVYTFFDPEFEKRSLGSLAILKMLELAAADELDWVYLGYWIADSPKMSYKNRFRPMQRFTEGHWVPMNDCG